MTYEVHGPTPAYRIKRCASAEAAVEEARVRIYTNESSRAPPDVVEFYEAMPFDKAVDYREEAWRNA